MNQQATTTDELVFTRPRGEQEQQILTAEAVEFLTELVTRFTPKRNKLLAARIQQQQDIDDGKLPDFISETASIREGNWKIRGIPDDLLDRRVEITGPVERKMVINALNANVKVFMADFEDSLAPEWSKVIDGQINLRDAVNGTISYTNEAGKIYQLKPNPALLYVAFVVCICRKNTSPGVANLSRAACSTLPSISSTTTKRCWRKAAALISICQKRRPGKKRHGGAKCSAMQRTALTCRAAPLKRPC